MCVAPCLNKECSMWKIRSLPNPVQCSFVWMSLVLLTRCFSHLTSVIYAVANWEYDRHFSGEKSEHLYPQGQKEMFKSPFSWMVLIILRCFPLYCSLNFGVYPPCWMTYIVGNYWVTSKALLRIPSDNVFPKAPYICFWVPFSQAGFNGIDVCSTQRFVIVISILENINFIFQSAKSIVQSKKIYTNSKNVHCCKFSFLS